MKRFLSWLVLTASVILIHLCWALISAVLGYINVLIDSLSTFLQVICYLVGGSVLIGLLTAPILYGPALAIMASDSVSESRKGYRYIVCGIWYIVLGLLNLFAMLISKDFSLNCIYQLALGISFLISQKSR